MFQFEIPIPCKSFKFQKNKQTNPLKWYNSYYALNKVKGSGNLDVATGLNYRYKHSKYSVGISIPLIQRKASVVSSDGDYTNSFVFNEGAFKVFFNYGWVF
ncbi:hypothetical protein COL0002_05730 [Helicobacter pylori]